MPLLLFAAVLPPPKVKLPPPVLDEPKLVGAVVFDANGLADPVVDEPKPPVALLLPNSEPPVFDPKPVVAGLFCPKSPESWLVF